VTNCILELSLHAEEVFQTYAGTIIQHAQCLIRFRPLWVTKKTAMEQILAKNEYY